MRSQAPIKAQAAHEVTCPYQGTSSTSQLLGSRPEVLVEEKIQALYTKRVIL